MSDGAWIWLISLGSVFSFAIGVPVLLVIGMWVVGASMVIGFTLANIGSTLFEGLNFFGLLAMPLFILTGDLIAAGGIARRLSDFSNAAVGWLRGGLGVAALGASGLFSAISGSNAATVATIGSILYPEMTKHGYDRRFSAATLAAGGTVGIIIPPSILLIVYGFMMNLSIADLFVAGIIPGALMVIVMQAVCFYIGSRRGLGGRTKFGLKALGVTARRAYLGFATIILILLGIYLGIFSPTEAAGVAAGFSLIAGLLVTREIKLRKLPDIVFRSGRITGMLAPLVAISIAMQQILSVLGAEKFLTELVTSAGGQYAVLAVCMVLILIAGMLLESLPNTIILAPILAPIAVSMGFDPVHFAIIFMMGAAIGFITPPYGLNLFVVSGITGVPYLSVVRFIWPYLFALLAVWMAVALYPILALAPVRGLAS